MTHSRVFYSSLPLYSRSQTPEGILANLKKISDATRTDADGDAEYSAVATTIRNNGGGFVNHNLYFDTLKPYDGETTNAPTKDSEIEKMIIKNFSSFQAFKDGFSDKGAKLFGSGWVWLSIQRGTDKVQLSTTANQDTPLMNADVPFLALDIWEHACTYFDTQRFANLFF